MCATVPVIDSGEDGENWVLVMPRADLSLSDYLDEAIALSLEECVACLNDIGDALADLDGKVVHRDLAPENVLRLDAGVQTASIDHRVFLAEHPVCIRNPGVEMFEGPTVSARRSGKWNAGHPGRGRCHADE